jgi:hypothetical protein
LALKSMMELPSRIDSFAIGSVTSDAADASY